LKNQEEEEIERTISEPLKDNGFSSQEKNFLVVPEKFHKIEYPKREKSKNDLSELENEKSTKFGHTPEKFERDKTKHFTIQDNFSQNSITSLIAKKKQINKRNSEVFEHHMKPNLEKMQASCNLKSPEKVSPDMVDEIKEEETTDCKINEKEKEKGKMLHRKSIPKPLVIENKHTILPSKKSPNSGFMDTKEPISPNRSILFFDFMKDKFGESKFSQLMLIIEKYQTENQKETAIQKDDYEKIKELIGEVDANYIVKFLRFILKLTPKGNVHQNPNKFEFAILPKEGSLNNGEQYASNFKFLPKNK